MKQNAIISLILGIILMLIYPAVSSAQSETEEMEATDMGKPLGLFLADTKVSVEWEENDSVAALAELAASEPLTVRMSMYGGFEQVGPLGISLPHSDSQTTTQAGDIVLFSGNQIVIFYGSNAWAYTRLGRINDKSPEELAALLGNGDIDITITSGGDIQ